MLTKSLNRSLRVQLKRALFGLVFNSMALLFFVVETYRAAEELPLNTGGADAVKVLLATYFFIEYMQNLLESNNHVYELLKPMRVLDFFVVICLIDDLYNNAAGDTDNSWKQNFLWLLLSLKSLRLKEQIFALRFARQLVRNPNKIPSVAPLDTQFQMLIFRLLLNIVALCIIVTSLILFVDELSNFQSYSPYDVQRMYFHNALYFQIITMTTIGMGDIYPITVASRLITTGFVIVCFSLFSRWITQIIELLSQKQQSSKASLSSVREYTVVVGNLAEDVQSLRLFLTNHYQRHYARSAIGKFTRELLLVSRIRLTHDPNAYIRYETLRSEFNIERIKHLECTNYTADLTWLKKAQVQRASALICYHGAQNGAGAEGSLQEERKLLFLLGIVHRTYPWLKIYVFFQNHHIVRENSSLRDVQASSSSKFNVMRHFTCRRELSARVLAHAAENDGVGAALTHLLSNKDSVSAQTKNVFAAIKRLRSLSDTHKYWMRAAYRSLRNQLFCDRFPTWLVGKTFLEATKFLFFEHAEASKSILLLGVKRYTDKQLLVTPFTHFIQDGDKAIYMAHCTQGQAQFAALTVDAFNTARIQNIELNTDVQVALNELVASGASASLEKPLRNGSSSGEDSSVQQKNKRILRLDRGESLAAGTSEHLLVFGVQAEDVHELLQNLRAHNKQRLIVFVQCGGQRDQQLSKNALIAMADVERASELSTLHNLCAGRAYKVLLRFTDSLENAHDMHLLRIYRNLRMHFAATPVLLALHDERILQFLDERPFQRGISPSYWPHCLRGTVVLENAIFHQTNSLAYYHSTLAKFITTLLSTSSSPQLAASPSPARTSAKAIVQETECRGLRTLTITQRVAQLINCYADLQYYLLSPLLKSPMLAIALIKKSIRDVANSDQSSPQRYHSYSSSSNKAAADNGQGAAEQLLVVQGSDQPLDPESLQPVALIQDINIEEAPSQTLLRERIDFIMYEEGLVAVNPPSYGHRLEEGDQVIVLADLKELQQLEEQVLSRDQERLVGTFQQQNQSEKQRQSLQTNLKSMRAHLQKLQCYKQLLSSIQGVYRQKLEQVPLDSESNQYINFTEHQEEQAQLMEESYGIM